MKRFIQFNDETVNSFLLMELNDLAKTLTRNSEIEVLYGPHSYLDQLNEQIFVSHFWDHRPFEVERAGLKTDIYLRAVGNYDHTDLNAVGEYVKKANKSAIPSFARQLLTLAEDIRIEELCKERRPGTKRMFAIRRETYRKYFDTQLNVNQMKSLPADSLFNAIYLLLNADYLMDAPSINEPVDAAMPFIRQTLMRFYETKSTQETITCCLELIDVLEELLARDMLNTYFHLPDLSAPLEDSGDTFDDMRRKDPLANQDVLDQEKTGEEEILEEEFRTWHRETSELSQSFLQFDLDQGSQTDLFGEGVREGEAGDQALAMVQGAAQKTDRKDFEQLLAEQMQKDTGKTGEKESVYGKENRYAVPVYRKADPQKQEERDKYREYHAIVAPLQKKLKNMIEKTLEHKKIQPRQDLKAGRLNKKLLRFFLDEQPRLFYKKQEPSPEIDAAFTLLVDCSASMFDKMDQTKLGITLFHEALKSVRVPHEIIGFWEDTNEASETNQPNYLQTVIDYRSSVQQASGPEIMQLEPEEDNRDGFAIRLVTERIIARAEKQKFLLVFSDGEPAAFDYDRNGIVDTHEAVLAARKWGIEVINVFLANGEIDEAQRSIIQNIYGKYSIFVSDINELSDVLFPLLRKLLYKSL
ncbi:nitric oxide reductase activation protein [Bacillus ectoiniformans]|uniref:nitric oxide reductase activation protein NorD n=1 Tax=Bacillus ectoiniformans TaxID=1494429 RepID=UPI001958A265|nr:hypothetical protein [Bacillus ectoiniformans]MBM7647731.1 nitric oxide reductase activation protein [Bacillus ectoiniformans]